MLVVTLTNRSSLIDKSLNRRSATRWISIVDPCTRKPDHFIQPLCAPHTLHTPFLSPCPHPLSLALSLSLFLPLPHSLHHSFPLYLSRVRSLSLSQNPPISLPVSPFLSLSPSLHLRFSPSLSQSLSPSLSPSLHPLSPSLSLTHRTEVRNNASRRRERGQWRSWRGPAWPPRRTPAQAAGSSSCTHSRDEKGGPGRGRDEGSAVQEGRDVRVWCSHASAEGACSVEVLLPSRRHPGTSLLLAWPGLHDRK